MSTNASPQSARRLPARTVVVEIPPFHGTRAADPASPEMCDALESLDDAMFAAIDGDTCALAAARAQWENAVEVLHPALLEESRDQYLRYALESLARLDVDEPRRPAASLPVLEVIDLLTAR